METSKLKKFAQFARRSLIEQVSSKLIQVLKEESPERRELPQVVAKLEEELATKGEESLIEQVAYVWFNRFCALRFMDVNGYNRISVLSPAEGQFQPEILAEAKAGHIDEGVVNAPSREKIFGLLNGSVKSRDGQSEAYRLLIVAMCNDYHRIMPYLFERIEDYTELLMPDDLLSGNSILAYTREAMTPEACESVECIGWLYQFYISEKKDQVFEGLKKNKKITPENIPAATQLFTPHWIVRYLVENSLGRLWMLNNPSSKVIEQMDYYIKPAEEESDFLRIGSPEEIKVCDPACGSGHMLTYAYDLLYAIYLDAGYDPVDIPELILTKNLYGIEIDERAAELAAFALSMKALKGNPTDDSNNRRRFFRNPIEPNICRLESVSFKEEELNEYFDFVGLDLFTQDLRVTLKEFEEGENFGSLIQPTLKYANDVLATLEAKDVSGQLFLTEIHKRVLRAVGQADYLSQKYHVVVANPPYMGSKGMNPDLAKMVREVYKDTKADLFAAFIQRCLSLGKPKAFISMITMQSWMFLSSYENFRERLVAHNFIYSMAHLGSRAFDTIGGEVVATTAFVIVKKHTEKIKGRFIRLVSGASESEKNKSLLEAVGTGKGVFEAAAEDFNKIPGSPLAFWVSDEIRNSFCDAEMLSEYAFSDGKNITGDNNRFQRYFWEISGRELGKDKRWVFISKGGGTKKWSETKDVMVDWSDRALEYYKKSSAGRLVSEHIRFRRGISWGLITTTYPTFRLLTEDFTFSDVGMFFHEEKHIYPVLAFLNTKLAQYLLNLLNPTLNFPMEVVLKLPVSKIINNSQLGVLADRMCQLTEVVSSNFEDNYNFKSNPLVPKVGEKTLVAHMCKELYERSLENVSKAKSIEIEINNTVLNVFELTDSKYSNVDSKDITLRDNPSFNYGDNIEQEKLNRDYIVDLISYSVGCLFGRFSIDREGFLLVSQGETLNEYIRNVPKPSFMPDDDNVIPMIDVEGDWFEDDISERFKEFLKATFGEDHFSQNLAFVEEAIGKDIKKYFVKDFYVDHVKRYKKRPIYWLFSSPKGTFNAFIYMHRYRPDTVSVVLNDYLREFSTKLQARKQSYEQVEVSASASQKEKTQAIKAIDKINKVLDEVNDYERDILYPLAGQNIEIDLDDGVKHNYPLFGKALKKVTGLS